MSRIHPVVAIKICNTFHGHLSNTFLSSFTASGKVVDWYTDKLTLTSLAYKQTKKQETHDWHQSALWFTTTLLFQVNPSETMHNNFKKSPTAYLWLLLIVFRVLFFPAYCWGGCTLAYDANHPLPIFCPLLPIVAAHMLWRHDCKCEQAGWKPIGRGMGRER